MKILITGLLSLAIAVVLGATAIALAPYYYYYQAFNNNYNGDWYSPGAIPREILVPDKISQLKSIEENQSNLWKSFQFFNISIPIPVKNPFYNIVPILEFNEETNTSQLGLKFLQPNGLILAQVLFLPNSYLAKNYRSQKLFELPVVTEFLNEHSSDDVFNDIFTTKISSWNIAYMKMVYNLYLLEKRKNLFVGKTQSFGLLTKSLGRASIESTNKDFKTEIIYGHRNRKIFNILIQWRNDSEDASDLRARLINGLSYQVSSSKLSGFIYNEFKQLSFKRQTDQEGLAYLLAAWSQDTSNKELIRSMIYFMERGTDNEEQLRPLYIYAKNRYDTTFTNSEIKNNLLTGENLLKHQMELEQKKEKLQREKEDGQKSLAEPDNLTPQERLKIRLENAKKLRLRSKKNQMIMN